MKNKLNLITFLSVVFAFLFVGVIMTTHSQTQRTATSKENNSNQIEIVPIVDFDAAESSLNRNETSPQEVERRLKKNERYNNLDLVWELPSEIEVKPKSAHWTHRVPALPIEQSDEIVIGVVRTGQAFLSTDRTGIYSEFSVPVEKILKSTSSLSEGQEILVERIGGAVRFPSGRLQRIEIFKGQEMPQIGLRYVFFLKKLEGEKDFSILTAYELKQNKVKPLDAIAPYINFKNQNEQIFIDQIIEEVLQKTGGN